MNEKLRKLAQDGYTRWAGLESDTDNIDCWDKAFDTVKGSCLDMTREEKMQFAWSVLVCYYDDTGRPIPLCTKNDIRACTRELSTTDFDIFTQFYNHGDSICFYRESKEWQDRTDRSVRNLEHAATETTTLLSQSIAKENELLKLQDQNLLMHQETLNQGKCVLNTITETREHISNLNTHLITSFDSMRNETESYLNKIHLIVTWTNEKMEVLSRVQSYLQMSFSDTSTLVSFTLKTILVYVITALPGITFLRPYLYLYVLVTVLSVKLCSLFNNESIATMINLLLKGMVIGLCCLHSGYRLFFRRDLTKENHQLLQHLVDLQQNQQTPTRVSRKTTQKDSSRTCRSKYSLRSVCQKYPKTKCDEDEICDESEEEMSDYACRVLFMSDSSDSEFEC